MHAKTPRAVFFAAHPDDAELFGLGLLLKLQDCGWEISIVVATDGARSRGAADPKLARERAIEAETAARLAGARLSMLGYPDGDLALAQSAAERIADAIRVSDASLVVTHHPNDYHPDHRALSRSVTASITPGLALLYADPVFGVGPCPDYLVDITTQYERKRAALRCHITQEPEVMLEAMDTWTKFRALQTLKPNVRHAEGFHAPDAIFLQPDISALLPNGVVTRRFG